MLEFLWIIFQILFSIVFKIISFPFKLLFSGFSFKGGKILGKVFGVIFICFLGFFFYTGKFIPSKIPFDKKEKEYKLAHNDLKAIMMKESSGSFMVVNVNDRGIIGGQLKGATYFNYEIAAYFYIHTVLRTLNQNFDIGPFQINSYWLKRDIINYSYISLFNPFISINSSAEILGDNYSYCRKKGFKDIELSKCAYSRYNTGKIHTKSKIGLAYANKMVSLKKKITSKTYNENIIYIPFYKYFKL